MKENLKEEKGVQHIIVNGKEYQISYNLRKIGKINQYFRKARILDGKTPLALVMKSVASMGAGGQNEMDVISNFDIGVDVIAPLLAFGLDHEKNLNMNVEKAYDILENENGQSSTYFEITASIIKAFLTAHVGGGMLTERPAQEDIGDEKKVGKSQAHTSKRTARSTKPIT